MSKLKSVSHVSNSGFTNKAVMVSFLAIVVLVSVVPLYALNSEAAAVTLKLTPVRSTIGTSVTATGKGYSPGSTVTIKFGTATVAKPKANITGGIDVQFTVPQVKAGVYTVVASDSSGDSTHATFTVGSRAHITLKPSSGLAGSPVTITGKGFAYSSALTVDFNNKKLTTGTSLSNGTFSLNITVPSDSAGSYAVSVTDALGYTASAAFTIS